MVPATGTFEPGHPWRGKPTFEIKYDKPAAQKLMQEAGYGPNKKLVGQDPDLGLGIRADAALPMNEYLQQALANVIFDVQLDVIEWNTLFTTGGGAPRILPPTAPTPPNVTYAAMDPFLRFGALPAIVDGAAGLEQLGLYQQSQIRRAGDQGAPRPSTRPRAMRRWPSCMRPPSTTRRSFTSPMTSPRAR